MFDSSYFFCWNGKLNSFIVSHSSYFQEKIQFLEEMNAYLEGEEKQKGFNWVVTSVDEITHEKIIRIRAFTAHLEKLHQIVKLPVNITTNLQPSTPLEHITEM